MATFCPIGEKYEVSISVSPLSSSGVGEKRTLTGLEIADGVGRRVGRPRSRPMPYRSATSSVQRADLKASVAGPVASWAQSEACLAVATPADAGGAPAPIVATEAMTTATR